MLTKTRFAVCVFAAGMLWMNAAVGFGQHHDRHGVVTHRPSITIFSPLGHRVTEHHDDYRYVVPATPHHGSFYNYEDRHYYAPLAPVVVVGQPPPPPPRPAPIEFGAFKHYESLADRLETLMNQFCLDLHYNYQHNRNYAETYREAYQLLQAAKYVHGSEHRGDRNAIRRSAANIDNLFHHMQSETRDWTRVEYRPVGSYSLAAKTEELQALIHHLMYDIGVKPDHDRDEQAPPPRREVAPPPR